MTQNCCGLTGRLFGHKFDSFIVKYVPPTKYFVEEAWGHFLLDAIDKMSEKSYLVRCKRCGALPEFGEKNK